MVLQSAVLGLGAYLVIHRGDRRHHHRELDPDLARAGAGGAGDRQLEGLRRRPPELAAAERASRRAAGRGRARLALPEPAAEPVVEAVIVVPPGTSGVVVQDVSFALKAGQGLGIIGPSASGKSSLARGLVGVWTPVRGKVRLDGAALDQWTPDALGPHVGYLPQDVELFAGTVAQNIARFEPERRSEAIIAAAQGRRRARADPAACRKATRPRSARRRRGALGRPAPAHRRWRARSMAIRSWWCSTSRTRTWTPRATGADAAPSWACARAAASSIVVAHRPSALAGVDHVLVMADGRAQAVRAQGEVLASCSAAAAPAAGAPVPLRRRARSS